MPELPEVETVRRGLLPVLEGRTLARVEVNRPDLRWPFPIGLARFLAGRRVTGLARRSKYLLASLDDGHTLLLHLGMSGRILIGAAGARPAVAHDHLRLLTDEGMEIVLNDPRRFGIVDLIAPGGIGAHKLLKAVGPEPLEPDFTADVLERALAGRVMAIKTALMDQRVVAGIGNIYASEALFRARISPRREAGSVAGARATRLVAAIKTVLAEAIAAGGSTLRDHRRPDGELGYFQHSFAVYDRAGKACPGCDCDLSAGGGIRRIVQGGRATFYCPRRQR